jgi:flotillin
MGTMPWLMPVLGMVALVVLIPLVVGAFLRNVDAGEIRLVSWLGVAPKIYRGPCKAYLVPMFTVSSVIPAQAINVDIEITDQTADVDVNGRPAPVKVTVKASAIVSVGEDNAMVNTAANKFFSKRPEEQLSTLTDVLSSAGRRAVNLLKHDQLFNARSGSVSAAAGELVSTRSAQPDDDELAVIIKDACSRELLDLGLSFNSLNIKAVLSEVAEARRRESAARAKASADMVQAQEEQRARIAQLEAQQKINDQEKALNVQIASNAATIARAEAEKQAAIRQQREAELSATQITQAKANAEQNVITMEADGRAQAARIVAVADAEAEAIGKKAGALLAAGQAYLDLRRLELAPALTHEIAAALAQGQFINFGSTGAGGQSAAASGTDDVMRVVQTLMAAQIITGGAGIGGGPANGVSAAPPQSAAEALTPLPRPALPPITAAPPQQPARRNQ